MGDGMMDGHKMGHGMLAGQGMSHGMGHGMIGGSATMSGHGMIGGPATMGGHGMMGGHVDGGPTLSVEQRKQMSRIQTALRKHNWALQGDIIDARGELFDLYIEETPNAKKIGAVYAKIFDLRRQMIEATIDAQNRVRAIVTTE
jgi:Spy/CpxP family protein refolding chaperone